MRVILLSPLALYSHLFVEMLNNWTSFWQKWLSQEVYLRSACKGVLQVGWLSAKNWNSFTHAEEYLLVLMHCDFKSPIANQRSYYFLSEASHEVLHFVWLGPWNLQLTQKNKPSSLAQCEQISNLLGQPSYQPLHLLLSYHFDHTSVLICYRPDKCYRYWRLRNDWESVNFSINAVCIKYECMKMFVVQYGWYIKSCIQSMYREHVPIYQTAKVVFHSLRNSATHITSYYTDV